MTDFPDRPPTAPPTAPPTSPPDRAAPTPSGASTPPPSGRSTRSGSTATTRRSTTGRTVIGSILVLVAGISATLGFASFWAQHEILDTDTWVATSRAIVDDPVVQGEVARSIAEQIVESVGVENLVRSTLPPPFDSFSGVLADQSTNLLTTATETVVATEAFTTVWDGAVRAVHDEFVHAVDGTSTVTTIGRDGLYLQVGPALDAVRAQLVSMGVPLLDRVDLSAIDVQVLLVDAPGLDHIQTWVRVLRIAVIVLPAVAVVALLAGMIVTRRRSVAVIAGGVGVLLGSAAVLAVMAVEKSQAVDEISGGLLGRASAEVIVDQIGSGMDRALMVTTIVGIGVIVLGIVAQVIGRPTEARIAAQMERSIAGDGDDHP